MDHQIDVVEFYYEKDLYSYSGEYVAGDRFKTLDAAIKDMERQATIYDPRANIHVEFDEMDTSEADDSYLGFIAVHWKSTEEG